MQIERESNWMASRTVRFTTLFERCYDDDDVRITPQLWPSVEGEHKVTATACGNNGQEGILYIYSRNHSWIEDRRSVFGSQLEVLLDKQGITIEPQLIIFA